MQVQTPDATLQLCTMNLYGDKLSSFWIGEGGVDIFYWEQSQILSKPFIGENSKLQNINVRMNSINGARYGVRAGTFLGADFDGTNRIHRPRLFVVDNNSAYRAGRNLQAVAGFRNIHTYAKNGVFNPTGGVGVKIVYSDDVTIASNEISHIYGGIGVEVNHVKRFKINSNLISNVRGRSLSLAFRWDGGEGIRVWNSFGNPNSDPDYTGAYFNPEWFEIFSNLIRDVSSYGIYIYGTANGKVSRETNQIERFVAVGSETRPIFLESSLNIDERFGAAQSTLPIPNKDVINYIAALDISANHGNRNWFLKTWVAGIGVRDMAWDIDSSNHWRGHFAYDAAWVEGSEVILHPDVSQVLLEWRAPRSGRIRVSGNVRKSSISGGDGVAVSIWKNDAMIWPSYGVWQIIEFQNANGIPHSFDSFIRAGEIISFRVDQRQGSAFDSTAWRPRISYL
jgi:hypothetical protein